MDKYRVTLTLEERDALASFVSAGKAAARKLTHAHILLLADEACGPGQDDDFIVAALGVSCRTVVRVRERFVTCGLHVALDRKSQPCRPGHTHPS